MLVEVFMSEASVKKLKTTVLRASKGRKVSNGDNLLVRYDGTLMNGDRFDANFDFTSFLPPVVNYFQSDSDGAFVLGPVNSNPFEFTLGGGQVISGWEQGLNNRRLGEVVELTIPADLAYGDTDRPGIPANSALRFKVEVLASIPEGETTPLFPSLEDIKLNPEKLGLTSDDFEQVDQVKIGLDGDDRLNGDNADDLLIGLKGNDRLFGAAGADLLIGGKGKNRFIYSELEDSPNAKGERDQIFGFGKKDKIKLRAMADDLQFIGSDKFTGAPGDVRFAKETLSVDLDGDQSADFAVKLPGITSLKGSNLLL